MEKYSQKTAQKGAFFKIFKPIMWATIYVPMVIAHVPKVY